MFGAWISLESWSLEWVWRFFPLRRCASVASDIDSSLSLWLLEQAFIRLEQEDILILASSEEEPAKDASDRNMFSFCKRPSRQFASSSAAL